MLASVLRSSAPLFRAAVLPVATRSFATVQVCARSARRGAV